MTKDRHGKSIFYLVFICKTKMAFRRQANRENPLRGYPPNSTGNVSESPLRIPRTGRQISANIRRPTSIIIR